MQGAGEPLIDADVDCEGVAVRDGVPAADLVVDRDTLGDGATEPVRDCVLVPDPLLEPDREPVCDPDCEREAR